MGETFFGVAGWSYKDWEGIVYPPDKRRGFDPLSYLATFFDTIELNNSFYRIPEPKMAESWARRVSHNRRFRFTAKLWQGFTHEKGEFPDGDVKKFKQAIEPLRAAGRLGALLAQFPLSFRNENGFRTRLSHLVEQFSRYPLVVEFRHRSWVQPTILEWLSDHAVGFCNVDEPVFKQMLKPSSIVTGPVAYLRLHGRNYKNWFHKEEDSSARYDYLYSLEELDDWVPRIREMSEKTKDLYVIGNNHFRGQAPANILQLKSKTVQGPVNVPDSLRDAFPQLEEIARSPQQKIRKQPSLFPKE